MKRSFAILILLIGNCLFAQIVDIPDSNFKDALVNYPVAELGNATWEDVDTNDDGEIQESEAEAVLYLFVQTFNIDSLEGIQSFTNITWLKCVGNNLTSLDVSQNSMLEKLYFGANQMQSIDVSQNQSLEEFDCSQNQITSLDFSQNPNLTYVQAYDNLLTSIDVTQNPNLEILLCSKSLLTTIDVSQNLNLKVFHSSQNQFTNLNVTQNTDLETLYCGDNSIQELDLTQNPNLEFLNCLQNQLTSLDVTQNPNLNSFNCSQNQITSLDLSSNQNMFTLNCSSNNLLELNIKNGNNIFLNNLNASENPNLSCIQVDDEDFANNESNWFKDETAVYSEDCSLGLNEVLETQFSIYTNPVNNVLILYNESNTSIESLKVYDTLGKLVFEQNNPSNQIEVSSLNSGLFFIHIQTDNGTAIKKVIKE